MIGGHYLMVMPLSKRSDGAVWQAMDTDTGHQVALNVFGPESDGAAHVQRFLATMERVQHVEHRNVVLVLGTGSFEDGQRYASMELLDGLTLTDRISEEPPIKLSEFVHIAGQTLDGLSALHESNIVHGHIEPDSIFIESVLGRLPVKLIGIGGTRPGERKGDSELQQLHALSYASPEQLMGQPVTEKSDLYSVGVVMFQAIAGKLPLHGQNVEELREAILNTTKPTLRSVRPDVPKPLSEVIARALETSPEARFESAKTMRTEVVSSILAATDEVKASLLPVTAKDADFSMRVVEWDYSELAQDVDPNSLDRNLVIQVQQQRRPTKPPAPKPAPAPEPPPEPAPMTPEPEAAPMDSDPVPAPPETAAKAPELVLEPSEPTPPTPEPVTEALAPDLIQPAPLPEPPELEPSEALAAAPPALGTTEPSLEQPTDVDEFEASNTVVTEEPPEMAAPAELPESPQQLQGSIEEAQFEPSTPEPTPMATAGARPSDAADSALKELLGGPSDAPPAERDDAVPSFLQSPIQPAEVAPADAQPPEDVFGDINGAPPSDVTIPHVPEFSPTAPIDGAANPFVPSGIPQKRTGVWIIMGIVVLAVAFIAAVIIGFVMATGCAAEPSATGRLSTHSLSSAIAHHDGSDTPHSGPAADRHDLRSSFESPL